MITKEIFKYKNHRCVIVERGNTPLKYNCGYVEVNKFLFGKNYRQKLPFSKLEIIDYFDVHGGITYIGDGSNFCTCPDTWWIGFDCAHAYDTIEKCNVAYCINECKKLVDQIIKINLKVNLIKTSIAIGTGLLLSILLNFII